MPGLVPPAQLAAQVERNGDGDCVAMDCDGVGDGDRAGRGMTVIVFVAAVGAGVGVCPGAAYFSMVVDARDEYDPPPRTVLDASHADLVAAPCTLPPAFDLDDRLAAPAAVTRSGCDRLTFMLTLRPTAEADTAASREAVRACATATGNDGDGEETTTATVSTSAPAPPD